MKETMLRPGHLLDKDGNLIEEGYCDLPYMTYDRDRCAHGPLRLKEWDYYYVGDKQRGLAITIADNGYMSLSSVSFFDFKERFYHEKAKMGAFPLGRLGLPLSPEKGDVSFKRRGFALSFLNGGKERKIAFRIDNFLNRQSLEGEVVLRETNPYWMCIATPFEKKGCFYWNCKKNCFKAAGSFRLGVKEYRFDDDATAVLDYGRGVWTYRNTWYWASMSDYLEDGRSVGLNLGYGFGKREKATENVLFLDGKAYRLGELSFEIPRDNRGKDAFISDWKIVSKDGRTSLLFHPLLYRHNDASALIIRSNQNQVFGTFSGTIDIGWEKVELKDAFGFAEKVINRW